LLKLALLFLVAPMVLRSRWPVVDVEGLIFCSWGLAVGVDGDDDDDGVVVCGVDWCCGSIIFSITSATKT
jgi:hypothetical protein